MRTAAFFICTLSRRVAPALPLLALVVATACKDTIDKVNGALYKPETNSGWTTDSAFLASSPTVLFRVYHHAGTQFVMPIAIVGTSGLRDLHMTDRGWRAFDIDYMYSGKKIVPLRNGQPIAPITIVRGMWEDPLHPLDTLAGCPAAIPRANIVADHDISLALTSYNPPGGKLLDAGELQAAINLVPSLVAPTLGVSGAQLSRYQRSIHQVAHIGGTPSIVLEYHDPVPAIDTGMVQGVR
ncbi:MAG: hypothetical protein M3Y64_02815, partial [Gemmatimonadota bacterium]|nr:hypothetical protein [Gemmatimonadota bacterium]